MNYDNERANRMFTLFMMAVIIAFFLGGLLGAILATI